MAAENAGEPPLRLLIGFSPRSASDDLARLIEPELGRALGRPPRIVYLPGEAGARAAREVIAAPPDGTSLMIATFGTHAIAPIRDPAPGYHPLRDFAPVALATRSPMILAVNPEVAARTVAELIALADRTELRYASSSAASAPYLATTLFQRTAGVRMRHVAYADTRLLYDDLVAGRLDLSINNVMTMLPLVRAGKLRALAVTTASRIGPLPEIPTLVECGLGGCVVANWLGFVAPPGTPDAIVAAQNRAIRQALLAPSTCEALAAAGVDVVASTAEAFACHIAEELKRWSWLGPSPAA